jgi:hypothetical protein
VTPLSSRFKTLALALAMLGGALASSAAEAGGRVYFHGPRIGISIGGPLYHPGYRYWGPGPYWGPGYWGPRYYYPPPAVVYAPPVVYGAAPIVAAPAPQQYVERADQPLEPGFWYWCRESQGYYPNVRECPSGWQQVPPQSAAPAQPR